MVFERVLAKLKTFGIETNNIDEFNIKNLIEDIKIEIVTYCNLDDYPQENKQLDNILANLVVFNFLKSKNTAFSSGKNEENTDNIKSINVGDFSVGDFSVSYGTSDSAITNQFISNEIDKYYLMLNKFRRLKW